VSGTNPRSAVNTKTSIPFKAAIMEPMPERRRCTKMSNASFARAFPCFYRSLNLAHVAGDSGDAEQSGLCIQDVV
jgi:hypothetical protein